VPLSATRMFGKTQALTRGCQPARVSGGEERALSPVQLRGTARQGHEPLVRIVRKPQEVNEIRENTSCKAEGG